MKAAFFNKPLEWNIETTSESWQQGSEILGKVSVKNHGTDSIDLSSAGVGLAYADIKKVHARTPGALNRNPVPSSQNKLWVQENPRKWILLSPFLRIAPSVIRRVLTFWSMGGIYQKTICNLK